MTNPLDILVHLVPAEPGLNFLLNAAALSGVCALGVLIASRVSVAAKSVASLLALLSLLVFPCFFVAATLRQAPSEPARGRSAETAIQQSSTPPEIATAPSPISSSGANVGRRPMTLPKINLPANPHAATAVAWAVGGAAAVAMALLARLVYALVFLSGYRNGLRCLNSDPTVASVLRETAAFLGCTSRIRVYSSPTLSTPVCTGLFNVAIVVPEQFVQPVDSDELRCILLHELAHAKAADHLVGLVQRVATAVYWWNPLVHFASSSYSQSREELCDTQAILGLASPKKYAQALVSIAEKAVLASRLPATVGMASSRVSLEARVRSILTKERDMKTMSTVPARVVLSVVSVALVALFSTVRALAVETAKAGTTAQGAAPRPPNGPPWHVTDPMGDSALLYESASYAGEIEKCELALRSFRRNPEKAGAALFTLAGLYLDRERARLFGLRDAGTPEAAIVPDYSAALTRYEALLRDYPSFELNDQTLYRIAWLQWDRGQMREDALSRLVRDFPSSPLVTQATFELSDAVFMRQDYTRAYELFSKLGASKLGPRLRDMVQIRLAECLMHLGDTRKAGEVYAAYGLECDTSGDCDPAFREMAMKGAGVCASMLKSDGQNVFQK